MKKRQGLKPGEFPHMAPAHHVTLRMLREQEERDRANPWLWIREIAVVVVLALIISTLIRIFLIQVFYIPSPSMVPTLQVNDRIAVARWTGWTGDIHRGDVVVFSDDQQWLGDASSIQVPAWQKAIEFIGLLPDSGSQSLVKRVIGLPGDTVECCTNGQGITVNGVAINEPYVNNGLVGDLPFTVIVPEGHIWVMGDNRLNSADSRFHMSSDSAFIPLSAVAGRAIGVV